MYDRPTVLFTAQLTVTVALLGLAIPSIAGALRVAAVAWAAASWRQKTALGAAVAAGAAARWLVAPLWLASIYMGYGHALRALRLDAIAHYGAGAQVLYHGAFALFGADHRVMMGVNAALGALAVPLVATWGARLLRDRRAGALLALLVALVPMFVRNDTSESNNVPALLWLFGGLVLWQQALASRALLAWIGALALAALASVTRPEMPALVAVAYHGTAWGAGERLRDHLRGARGLLAAVAALAVVPHIAHVASMIAAMRARSSLPGLYLTAILDPYYLVMRNAVLIPTLYPVPLTALAVWGLVAGRREPDRRAHLAVGAMALVALLAYVVDADWGNIARIHAPLGIFVATLGAAALSRLARSARRWLYPAALAVVAASAAPSAWTLWAPTNEQEEERLLRDAAAALSRGPFVLVTPWKDDRAEVAGGPGDHTALDVPTYLFEAPGGRGTVLSIGEWMAMPRWDRPAYFYAGTRCYAAQRREGSPAPHGDNLQPYCARMFERFVLAPVIERRITNRGDRWLPLYGDAPSLRLGLYRIRSAR